MLRTKQIGTISHCARSLLFNGPKCGSGDGASCTCSEDENCAPRRQLNRNDFLVKEKKPNAAFAAAAKSRSSLKNAVEPVNHCNSHNPAETASPHGLSPSSSLRPHLGCVNGTLNPIKEDDHATQTDLLHSSKLRAEHFVKAGIATVDMFSEIMNYRAPTTHGRGLLTSQNYMVDPTQSSSNVKSSKGKSRNRASFTNTQFNSPVNSSFNNVAASSSDSTYSDWGAKDTNTASANAKKNFRGTLTVSHDSTSEVTGHRQSMPHRVKFHSDNFISHARSGEGSSEGRGTAVAPYSTNKPVSKLQPSCRLARSQAGGRLSATQSLNSWSAVEQYYHTLQQLKWGPLAEEALNNFHFKLDAYQANQVLKLLRDPSVALGFFNWLKHQLRFKHDEHTYTTMIGILGQARQFGAITKLLEEMVSDGCQPTVVTYNRLIHAYGRANYIGEAIMVFHQMQEAGYVPDRVTYCTLIDIHAKAGYLEVALNLYQRMQEVGLSPDTFTYSAMINCLGKGGHLAAARKLFYKMIEHGCTPNLVTYNIMIALQAKARNYPSVVKLYHDMQAAGFLPDKITCNIVMEALGHCGHLVEAEAVFVEMQRDWVPDEPVYGLLVDLWGKAGNVDRARAWYQSMLDAGLQPNVPTCNSLLSAFLKVHRFADAHDVLQNMLDIGLVPSLQTYTLLLSCCTETRTQMGVCCKLMAITGHPAHMFLVSLPDAEPGGQNVRDHANSFLDLMHSEDRESKRGLVDAVIDFLHKSGLKEEAGSVWEVAAQRNVYPGSLREKSSLYWLINLHVMSEGTAVTALSRTLAWFRRQMLISGVGPSRIDIVTGWGRRSRVTGSSLVRQSIQELLNIFRFPFFTEYGNSGCFVGCGESLHRWLLNSYVDRMHLL